MMMNNFIHVAVAAYALLLTSASLAESALPTEPRTPRPLTVRDGIQTRSPLPFVINHSGGTVGRGPISVSPDGSRFVVALVRGDLERNGNWVEWISGSTGSMAQAAQLQVAARMFTAAKEDVYLTGIISLTYPGRLAPVWLDDNRRIAFLWSDGVGPNQVMVLDLQNHRLEAITHHPTAIQQFGISGDGLSLLYTAFPDSQPMLTQDEARWRNGFTVREVNLSEFLIGNMSSTGLWGQYEYFAITPARREPLRIPGQGSIKATMRARFSPDRRYVLDLMSPTENVGRSWERCTHPSVQRRMSLHRRVTGVLFSQARLIDLHDASAEFIWDAPSSPDIEAVWSPDSRRILIGPTCLPPEAADAMGLAGTAVAEFDLETRRIQQIPLPAGAANEFRPLRWLSTDTVEIGNGHRILLFKKSGGRWRWTDANGEWSKPQGSEAAAVQIEWRQGLNAPPALYAIDEAGSGEQLILEPEPRLRGVLALGRVRSIQWSDKRGRLWKGRLHYPVPYAGNQRYPLVIQTHGGATPVDEFSLSGNSVYATGYAAQPLANRGFIVLQTQEDNLLRDYKAAGTPEEFASTTLMYESAVDFLAAEGLIDRTKVGLMGYSRTCSSIHYALAESETQFAAAALTDGMQLSFAQYMAIPDYRKEFTAMMGAAPFGKGLKLWLERSPVFRLDRIRTPMRIEGASSGLYTILMWWDTFVGLTQLQKPVELSILPDAKHGAHPLQIPVQKLVSQEGTVDWFDFWLRGQEDPDPSKAAQYERWRKLHELHEASLSNPRPPRLKWTAEPVT